MDQGILDCRETGIFELFARTARRDNSMRISISGRNPSNPDPNAIEFLSLDGGHYLSRYMHSVQTLVAARAYARKMQLVLRFPNMFYDLAEPYDGTLRQDPYDPHNLLYDQWDYSRQPDNKTRTGCVEMPTSGLEDPLLDPNDTMPKAPSLEQMEVLSSEFKERAAQAPQVTLQAMQTVMAFMQQQHALLRPPVVAPLPENPPIPVPVEQPRPSARRVSRSRANGPLPAASAPTAVVLRRSSRLAARSSSPARPPNRSPRERERERDHADDDDATEVSEQDNLEWNADVLSHTCNWVSMAAGGDTEPPSITPTATRTRRTRRFNCSTCGVERLFY
jgi:hypothetical protein